MKGTALAVVVTVASADTCNFAVPPIAIKERGARGTHFSCADVSTTCCSGLEDAETGVIEAGGAGPFVKGGGKGRLMEDVIGTCGRADQVSLYNCAVVTIPKIAPAGKEGKMRQMIQAKGCQNVVAANSPDGSGHCDVRGPGQMQPFHIEGVSAGCCKAGQAIAAEEKRREDAYQTCMRMDNYTPTEVAKMDECRYRNSLSVNREKIKDLQCGLIGVCGKKDQKSILKFVEHMKGKGKGGGALQLLETYKFSLSASQEMMASFMPSEVEDDETEGDEIEDGGSQVMTGLLGFVAGAAVTGLGVTVLRRRTPSQDEYNEIVA